MAVRKKWDEQAKLQLGKLIREQLDKQVKLKEAVSRAADILQAPRSTCMLYWQKELKDIDYSKEPLTLPERKTKQSKLSFLANRPEPANERDISKPDTKLSELLEKVKESESKVRELYLQIGMVLNDLSAIVKDMTQWIDSQNQPGTDVKAAGAPVATLNSVNISNLAAGDIVRVQHHVWQDYYYISSVENGVVKGYKLNSRNMLIRRNSREKVLTNDMMYFIKLVHRNVKLEDVMAE
jgi:hypothetical protein